MRVSQEGSRAGLGGKERSCECGGAEEVQERAEGKDSWEVHSP